MRYGNCVAANARDHHAQANSEETTSAEGLAFSDRPGTSNGATEAINGRLAHLLSVALGLRNFSNSSSRQSVYVFHPDTTMRVRASIRSRGAPMVGRTTSELKAAPRPRCQPEALGSWRHEVEGSTENRMVCGRTA